MKLRSLVGYVLLSLFAFAPDCHGASYAVENLGTLPGFAAKIVPWAINNQGQVVGDAYSGPDATLPYHAFLYSNGAMQDLHTLGGASSGGRGINNAGQIVGFSFLPNVDGHAGPMNAFLDNGGGMQSIGTLIPEGQSNASKINQLGQIVGGATVLDNGQVVKVNFFYSGGVMTNLGKLGSPSSSPTVATDLNDSGQIVGSFYAANNQLHAFIFSNGLLQDLGTLGGVSSSALAVNEAGQVVGTWFTNPFLQHAFFYDGTMHDLGSLAGGDTQSRDVNNLGQVVGASAVAGVNHAFLYSGGQMLDLNLLIDPASGWILNVATGINDKGQITGTGTFAGQSLGFVITPVPEPGSLTLFAVGLAIVSVWKNRRHKSKRYSM